MLSGGSFDWNVLERGLTRLEMRFVPLVIAMEVRLLDLFELVPDWPAAPCDGGFVTTTRLYFLCLLLPIDKFSFCGDVDIDVIVLVVVAVVAVVRPLMLRLEFVNIELSLSFRIDDDDSGGDAQKNPPTPPASPPKVDDINEDVVLVCEIEWRCDGFLDLDLISFPLCVFCVTLDLADDGVGDNNNFEL